MANFFLLFKSYLTLNTVCIFCRHRDVHMTLHSYTNNTHIDAGVGIKWDVNRDPSCKFTFLLQTKSSGRLNHDGRCIIEYPGRAVTSTFYILHSGK